MTDRRTRLTDAVSALAVDGYVLDASTAAPNQRYVTGFAVEDPVVSLVTGDSVAQLYWGVDGDVAPSEGVADDVARAREFGYSGYGDAAAERRVVREFLRERGVESAGVPERFPVGTARAIEPTVDVRVLDDDPVTALRARKSPSERNRIETAASAADASLEAVGSFLSETAVGPDSVTLDGAPVTGADVVRRVRDVLADEGCTGEEVLVASGTDAASPHGRTSGPLDGDAPVVVDVVARGPDGYHADVCRTFAVGDPPPVVRDAHDLVSRALETAPDVLEPDTSAAELTDALCRVFEDEGVATPRTDPEADAGVRHYMVHGVGLAVHEAPMCTPDNEDTLSAGNVVAVEPAMYDPDWGGVRVEDVFAVTASGSRRLSSCGRALGPVR